MENWRLFWAKTNREKIAGLPEDWTHPLWAHLIDVGSAAQVLWDAFLPQSLKQKMANALGMNLDDAGRFLSIWIGLHDLGKGIPGFQGNEGIHENIRKRLRNEGGFYFHPDANRLHHGHASIAIVHLWLKYKNFNDQTLLHALAAFVGIHHGKICRSCVWENVAGSQRPEGALGDVTWKRAQHDLTEAVFNAWGSELPPDDRFPSLNPLEDPWPDWLMAFAGWATLADWLGSMQSCYDNVQAGEPLEAYMPRSYHNATEAYGKAGLNHQARLQDFSFIEHFGNEPRGLHVATAKLPISSTHPNLIIVEAPTGEGKTEAAFHLAAKYKGGMYVAMPSQATSNGLYPRLQKFIAGSTEEGLKAAHVGKTAALRLVHGNDLLHDDAITLMETVAESISDLDGDDDKTTKAGDASDKDRLLGWFMPKKRALLIPYGVGTVDQLFLGVLYAKHFFLRLFALCGKTVIFDEVHAYDAYMNTVFAQLLRWLRALDINVVVLSATLPGEARKRMLNAWGSTALSDAAAPFPVTWHAVRGNTRAYPFAPTDGREQHLKFQWCGAATETIVETVRQLVAQGATVIVVCNTVQRAQDIFKELDNDDLLSEKDRMLLHARMPQEWRQKREESARIRFGPKRLKGAGLLVGTQVIEQSLDLDVDALITDLAPVDLLLQRAGRLHRHKLQRPAGFERPVLYIACAETQLGKLPDVKELSGNGRIYETALLWKTWAVLHQDGGWALPLGNATGPGYRALIEAVYGDAQNAPGGLDNASQELYNEALPKWVSQDKRMAAKAAEQLIPGPECIDELFTPEKPELADEDDPRSAELAQHLVAATRNPGSLNAEVLLLYRKDNGWSIQPDGKTVLYRPKHQFMDRETLRALFGAAIRISNADVVKALWEEENPNWAVLQQKHRVLKRFYLVEMMGGVAVVGGARLTLDNRLGLRYEKTQAKNP